MDFKKRLYACRPKVNEERTVTVEAQSSRKRTEIVQSDSVSIERGIRQLLTDKVSGNLAGIWLLVAEHLRLGTWDLLRGWTNSSQGSVEARLAMQIVNESAVCTSEYVRNERLMEEEALNWHVAYPSLHPTRHCIMYSTSIDRELSRTAGGARLDTEKHGTFPW